LQFAIKTFATVFLFVTFVDVMSPSVITVKLRNQQQPKQ
jgi:hypothetical protein